MLNRRDALKAIAALPVVAAGVPMPKPVGPIVLYDRDVWRAIDAAYAKYGRFARIDHLGYGVSGGVTAARLLDGNGTGIFVP